MTPRERAELIMEQRWSLPLWNEKVGELAEQAITAAVEEVEDRVANERDSYLETIRRLESKASWTTDHPTQPGFYWIRKYQVGDWRHSNPGVSIVLVWPDFSFDFIGDDRGYSQRNVISAEWCGPIQPPE